MKTLALLFVCLAIAVTACAQAPAPAAPPAPAVSQPVVPAQQTVTPSPPPAPTVVAPAPTPASSNETTIKDQTDVAVTVYNNNLALVRDTRKITLPKGEQSLRFSDVAQQIHPESVSLKSVSTPGALRIIEQNFEYDLMSPAKLMEKYVGKEVKLINFSNEIGFSEKKATLLSVNEGSVFKIGDDIFLGHPGNVVLPEIPANMIAKPSLIWLLENTAPEQTIEATYLTGGVEWRADYVVTLDKAETKIDIAAWVTLNNQSGTQYTNAQLKLVAGEVNVAQPPQMVRRKAVAAKMEIASAGAAEPMRQEAFGEYHLYTLPHRTTINQNQSKQVSLLTANAVKAAKIYEYRGQEQFYYQPVPPNPTPDHVPVYLKFSNKEDNQLGVPLPGGVMRVYQEDSENMLQFSGEDRIQHTPKDEDVRIKLGTAFDIVAERKQADFKQIASNVTESAYEIKVRNHKTADIVVDVVEPFNNDWEILESSHKYEKKNARTAVFSVPVPKDGETVITYRVRVKW